ncbi:MAG TPA: hypothetical protein G4N94_11705 [Caldilineae bacterium]|nr:hypothetical protein [Caldilineae bacterium]
MYVFNSSQDNDLYHLVASLGCAYPRYETLAKAIDAAPHRAGVLSLADDYPRPNDAVSQALLDRAAQKELRLYIEYPASLPGLELGEPQPTEWERVVVASDFFAPQVDPLTILAQHGCWFLPLGDSPTRIEASSAPQGWQIGQGDMGDGGGEIAKTGPIPGKGNTHFAGLAPDAKVSLALARVAGYNTAVFGLPEQAHPILFEIPDRQILVATSKLSQFISGRYGPQQAWKAIWEQLLHWLAPDAEPTDLVWTPTVRVQSGPDAPPDSDAETKALRRSVKWFREHIVYGMYGKKGAIEGFESAINHEGRQMQRIWPRGDCTAETAMVFALDWALTRNPDSRQLATQMFDYVLSSPDFFQDDPDSPAYGLNNWYERGPVFYGDDNARVILSTLITGHLFEDGRWDERVLRCLLANLRTTGALGFRRNRIDLHHFFEDERGWRFFYQEEIATGAPHHQAYLWAAYLLAYRITGYDGFITKTKDAIRTMMDTYPNWQWTNDFTEEPARMLLPLAFLVRLEDTPEHRGWLGRIADDLLAQMQPCGAIPEQVGKLEDGRYPPPQSNETYGVTEAPLIQENGDPACDLLYTTAYAFLGLHEAALATGDNRIREAADRLADFLCRIQVRSEAHPYLDGAWMRGFDYERWEYWGSSADNGWGAWCVESGWSNSWIAATLAMRDAGISLFDAAASTERMKTQFPRLLEEMIPDEK